MKGLDELLQLFKSKRKLELGEVAKVLNLPEHSTLLWARTLKQDGILDIVQEEGKTFLILVGEKAQVEGKPAEAIPAKELSKMIEEYAEKIEEMRKKIDAMKNLEKERSEIMYKEYVPAERKFEVELHMINEQLAEKEAKIKELEERVKEVPKRITMIEAQAQKLEKVEQYIRFNLDKSRQRIEKEVDRIEEIRSLVERYTSEVNKRVEDQIASLRNVQKELARLKKMEDWIYIQQDMLEKNMKEYAEMRKQSLAELEELRDVMRAGFLKKYERELRMIRERHVAEIEKIKEREREYQQKIEERRKEVAKLTEETEKLLKTFEQISKRKVKVEREEAFAGELEKLPPAGIE